jgi:hypothetical protein
MERERMCCGESRNCVLLDRRSACENFGAHQTQSVESQQASKIWPYCMCESSGSDPSVQSQMDFPSPSLARDLMLSRAQVARLGEFHGHQPGSSTIEEFSCGPNSSDPCTLCKYSCAYCRTGRPAYPHLRRDFYGIISKE